MKHKIYEGEYVIPRRKGMKDDNPDIFDRGIGVVTEVSGSIAYVSFIRPMSTDIEDAYETEYDVAMLINVKDLVEEFYEKRKRGMYHIGEQVKIDYKYARRNGLDYSEYESYSPIGTIVDAYEDVAEVVFYNAYDMKSVVITFNTEGLIRCDTSDSVFGNNYKKDEEAKIGSPKFKVRDHVMPRFGSYYEDISKLYHENGTISDSTLYVLPMFGKVINVFDDASYMVQYDLEGNVPDGVATMRIEESHLMSVPTTVFNMAEICDVFEEKLVNQLIKEVIKSTTIVSKTPSKDFKVGDEVLFRNSINYEDASDDLNLHEDIGMSYLGTIRRIYDAKYFGIDKDSAVFDVEFKLTNDFEGEHRMVDLLSLKDNFIKYTDALALTDDELEVAYGEGEFSDYIIDFIQCRRIVENEEE